MGVEPAAFAGVAGGLYAFTVAADNESILVAGWSRDSAGWKGAPLLSGRLPDPDRREILVGDTLAEGLGLAAGGEIDAALDIAEDRLLAALSAARASVTEAFDALRAFAAEHTNQIGRDAQLRLTEACLSEPELRDIHAGPVMTAARDLTACARLCEGLLKILKDIPAASNDAREAPFLGETLQLDAYRARLERTAAALPAGVGPELAENTVRWIEIDPKNPALVRAGRCPPAGLF